MQGLSQHWGLANITMVPACYEASCVWLTGLEEAALGVALRFLLSKVHEHGKINLLSRKSVEKDCGLIVLGMEKLGAEEFNYSSEIDRIVFIDEMSSRIENLSESIDLFSKMLRLLIRIIEECAGEGYVFPLDFRLRSDPS